MVSSSDVFPVGKTWGPWLWYLVRLLATYTIRQSPSGYNPRYSANYGQNDGSKEDAAARAEEEFAAWPYAWFDDEAYHTRGSVSGQLRLSDGRPVTNAAVFLGDNDPNKVSALRTFERGETPMVRWLTCIDIP
jgi:rhamnogalacturonan endolyase